MITGDVSYYFNNTDDARPLKKSDKLSPGVTLQTGAGAQAIIKSPADTMINTTDKVAVHIPQEKAKGNKAVFVERFVNVMMTMNLEHNGTQLSGVNHIVRDNGTVNDYPISWSKDEAGNLRKAVPSKK